LNCMPKRSSVDAMIFARLMKDAAQSWYYDDAPSKGAAIAFYTIFSIAPLLIIAIAIAGYVFGTDAAQGQVFAQVKGFVGEDGAAVLRSVVKSASQPAKGMLAAAMGLTIMVVGATGVFVELQNTMDRIWKVPVSQHESSWWYIIRRRILVFVMMLAVALLLLVSLVISAGILILQGLWLPYTGGSELILPTMNYVGSFLVITTLFAIIFRYLPRASVSWLDVIVGSVVTAALFEIGKVMIGLYISVSGVGSGFGVAGAVVVMLIWVYYSAQIFLFGAELTWVYAKHYGSRSAQG
jgi:membrane protein